MNEKVEKLGLERAEGWLYFVRGSDVFRRRKGVPDAPEELLAKGHFTREAGYMYSLDSDGDVVRVKLATAPAKPAPLAEEPRRSRGPAGAIEKSRKVIAGYLGKRVTAELDGGLFDHVPATFRFRFQEPEKLAKELAGNYTDELGEMDCLDEEGGWAHETLIPVASVSAFNPAKPKEEPYEFAWVFLDWSTKKPPGVVITTTDDWGEDRTAKSLAALALTVGED